MTLILPYRILQSIIIPNAAKWGEVGKGGEGRTEGIAVSESGTMLMVLIDFTQLSIQHCAANIYQVPTVSGLMDRAVTKTGPVLALMGLSLWEKVIEQ